MGKYRVTLDTTASFTIEVEADDDEAAVEAAFDETPYLCVQCSGWGQEWGLDLGEFDVPRADDGKGEADWAIEKVGD